MCNKVEQCITKFLSCQAGIYLIERPRASLLWSFSANKIAEKKYTTNKNFEEIKVTEQNDKKML